jgi:hypothetical protein
MSLTDKKQLQDWQEYVLSITTATTIIQDESAEQINMRKEILEAKPDAWMQYYFPTYAFAAPAAFHIAATNRLIDHPEWYEVRLWSRELAKSTRTMMEVLYLMLVGHPTSQQRLRKRYTLMISNSYENAVRLLMPYKANLEGNQRLIQDYDIQEGIKWQAAEFTTQCGIAFRALGAGQSPRGSRNEAIRPDILLFDDIDTDADCLNSELVSKKWNWIEEAAIGTRSVSKPTTVLFCGNRIAIDCCVGRAIAFADHTDEINIRDEHGRSVWPEKNSEADIDRVLLQKSYAAAQKEYFNNPIVEGAIFNRMAYKPLPALHEYGKLICYTDPSYTDTNDFKATVLVGSWQDEYHIIKCFVDQTTTAHMLDWHLKVKELVQGHRCRFYMEDVFMQDVLIYEMNELAKKMKSELIILPDKRRKPNKYSRIETLLEPLHRNNLLYLNMAEQHNPHMQRLEAQFKAFAPGSNAHDDAPDAVEGAIWLIKEQQASVHPFLHQRPIKQPRINRF